MKNIPIIFALMLPVLAMGQTPKGDRAKVIRKLNEKQAQLLDRLGKVERLNATYGKLQAIRDRAYTDPGNLYLRSKAMTDAQLEWLKGWYVILGVLDSITPANSAEVISKVQSGIADQAEAFVSIGRQWASIHRSARLLEDSFATLSAFPAKYLPGYDDQIDQVNAQMASVADSLAKTAATMSPERQAEWRAASRLTRAAVTAKLKLIALEHTELEKYVKMTTELFRAEDVLGPLRNSSYKAFREFRDALLAGKVFETRDKLKALQTSVAKALATIEQSGLDGKYTTPVVDTLNQWQRSAEEQYDKLTALGEGLQVARFSEKNLRQVARICQDADIQVRKTANCELYRTLVRISRQQIVAMDEPTLEFFEQQVIKSAVPPRMEGI